ncbi:MAG: DUF4388 domain-containing protein [Nannocystis sp.]|nr:DUF4388 domain-containing protein [Nannocystis sp.]MBA3549509.1 DUF4388 domain-containing protein [Nannocystis sp.]
MKHAQDEMVLIDAGGSAHPLGEVATARMRERTGAYRMLPTPSHLVFLRFTGADGRRDLEDGPIVRMAGEITATGAMIEVLAILGQTGMRGELVVMDGDITRSVFFEHGNIVGVQTNAEDEKIGMLLYKHGMLSEEAFLPVLERARAGDRFGMAAVDLGFVSQEQIYKFLGRQVEEVVFSILMATDGAYCFLEGFDEGRLASRQVISANALLMHHLTRIDEIRHFRFWIPSAEHVPVKIQKGPPGPEYAEVWAAIDGRCSVGEIGRVTALGEFEVTRQVFQLAQVQALAVTPPRTQGGILEVVEVASSALRVIHQAADSGGRGTAVRNNLVGFARGAYDELMRGAGPFEHGGFGGPILVRNALALKPAGDAENFVREMLYDYVAFALFSVTATLGPGCGLAREVEPLLSRLRPAGQSGVYMIPGR